MARNRDDSENSEEPVSEQEILKVFDYEGDPVLTTAGVRTGLQRFGKQPSSESVRIRLERMTERGLISRRELEGGEVGWGAEVAPKLDEETSERIDSRRESIEWVEL